MQGSSISARTVLMFLIITCLGACSSISRRTMEHRILSDPFSVISAIGPDSLSSWQYSSSAASQPGTDIGIFIADGDTCLKVARSPDSPDITTRLVCRHTISQPAPGHYRLFLEFRTIDISSRGVWIAVSSFDGNDTLIEPNMRKATPDISGTRDYYSVELKDIIPIGSARTEIEIGLDREATGTLLIDQVEMFLEPAGMEPGNKRAREYVDGEIRIEMKFDDVTAALRRVALIDLSTGACTLSPNRGFVSCKYSLTGTRFRAQIEDYNKAAEEGFSIWLAGEFHSRIGDTLIGPFTGTARADRRLWSGRMWLDQVTTSVTGQLLTGRVEQSELRIRRSENHRPPQP